MRRLLPVLIFGLGGAAILAMLCYWQVQRLAWKEALIAEIEARIAAPAVALPEALDPEADAYLQVAAEGALGERELHVLTSARPGGPGYRVISALETADGRRVMVDRGYVREAEKSEARPGGAVSVTGNLMWPREVDGFTPAPNLERNIWFARDVAAMADALGTEPVLIVANAPTAEGSPRPLPVGVGLPNNHLQYAITWGLLAICWLGMTGYLVYRIRRQTF